jgi:hypothetical protein
MNIAVQIFIIVASFILQYAMRPDTQKPKPTAFEDIDFPQSEEGTPIAVIFGDCWSSDWMVLGVGNYRTSAIVKDGGKK